MVRVSRLSNNSRKLAILLRLLVVLLLVSFIVSAKKRLAFCSESDQLENLPAYFAKNLSKSVKEFPENAIIQNYILSFEDTHRTDVLELYEKVGFQPVFLTNGKLNKKGKRLLERLNSLVFDGIDVDMYALVSIQEKVARIEALNNILKELKTYISSEPKIFVERFCPAYISYVSFNSNPGASVFTSPKAAHQIKAANDTCEVFMQVIATANKTLINLNETASDLDAMLIARAFRLARDMGVEDKESVLDALARDDDLSDFLKLIEPKSVHYAPLRKALKALLEKCSYPPPETLTFSSRILRPGTVSDEVLAIKKRLKREGYYKGPLDNRYDWGLEEAVKEFQRANALQVDGIVGQETKEALKVPVEEKIRYVKLALAEFRKEPLRDLERGIVINIPQFMLEVYFNGQIIERHKVIVGKANGKKKKLGNRLVGINQTPELESKITRIVFKPRWYVNKRILKELEAESQGDPDYYVRQGFVFLPPRKPGGLPRVYQKPGEKNALGLVKFEFPNRYQVYLHDTPTKHLFSKSKRAFSHGCIRVENALKLAKTLLKLDNNNALNSIEKYLKRKNSTYVKLRNPFPIYVRYIPASTDSKGRVVILRDIYGRLKDKVDNKTMICKIGG